MRNLRLQWNEKYSTLESKRVRKDLDSGRLLAAQYLASCIKSVQNQRNAKRKLEMQKRMLNTGTASNYYEKKKKKKEAEQDEQSH